MNSHLKLVKLTHIAFNLTHVTAQLGLVAWGRAIRRWKAENELYKDPVLNQKVRSPRDSSILPDSATHPPRKHRAETIVHGSPPPRRPTTERADRRTCP